MWMKVYHIDFVPTNASVWKRFCFGDIHRWIDWLTLVGEIVGISSISKSLRLSEKVNVEQHNNKITYIHKSLTFFTYVVAQIQMIL